MEGEDGEVVEEEDGAGGGKDDDIAEDFGDLE